MSFSLTLMFPGLGLLQMTTHFPGGLCPTFTNPARAASAWLILFYFCTGVFQCILWGCSAELDSLLSAKHISRHPTAEHVLALFSCPGMPFFSSPNTQISIIKAQMATPPFYSPWLLLQRHNVSFLLTHIEPHLNDSLFPLAINFFIEQRWLYSPPGHKNWVG